MKKVIIIGSGFGGLSLGIRLQAAGYNVTIFEKNSKIGGHAYLLEKDGFKFDMGPSLITAPKIIDDIFKSAGKSVFDYLDFIKLNPFYRVYFHDKTYIDYVDDSEQMKSQLSKFNQRDAQNYDKFIDASEKIHDAVIVQGLGETAFMKWKTMFSFLPKALKLNALLSSYQFAARYFKDFRHRFLFSFHPLFIGGNPFRAPAVYQMIPYLEKNDGVWFTKGGMTSLVQAFGKLFTELGGKIKTDSPVQKIVIENQKATGVLVNDQFYPADVVASNADYIHTFKDLIEPQNRPHLSDKKLSKTDYSMSAFLLYIGTTKKYPELEHHTLILSHRYRELIKDIFDQKIVPKDFSMYLHVPTKTDPEMAPDGCENMYILIPVANLQGSFDWKNNATHFKETVLNFLEHDFGLTDLQKNIKFLEMFTPENFVTKNNNYYGSAWGVEPKLTQTAIFRPHNKNKDISNVYLVGASTHPGAGLPGVMLTAATTAKLIKQYH